MAVVSTLIGFGCITITWLLFISALRKHSPGTLDRLKTSGIDITYSGFSKAFYFKSINHYELTLRVSVTDQVPKRKGCSLRVISILSAVLGVTFSILSVIVIIWSIWSSFTKKESQYTLAAPTSNMVLMFFCFCAAILCHEMGHLLFMYSTKTPVHGFKIGIYCFIPSITIVSGLNIYDSDSNAQKGAINAIGGIVGNILSSLLAIALAYIASYKVRSLISSESLFVYLGESSHNISPYSLVQSLGNTTIRSRKDLYNALQAIETQYIGDYSSVEMLLDSKNTFSLTTGIRQSVQAQLAYQNSGDLVDVTHIWPPYTSTQILGGIQIPYTTLENVEPMQCHVSSDRVPILLSHYHVLSTSHLLVLSSYTIDTSLLSSLLSNGQSNLCHYSTADYVCMYPYFSIHNSNLGNTGRGGVYTRSTINGIQQMISLPISNSQQTFTIEGWRKQYIKQFITVPTSLVGTTTDTKNLKAVVQKIRKANKFTFAIQIFTEASVSMAILASIGFPLGSDGQQLLRSIIKNRSAQAVIQSAFWASSLTLCCVLALAMICSLF